MLGELARWRDWQGVHDSLRELVDSQEKLNADTSDVSRATVAKRFAELTPQGQADLRGSPSARRSSPTRSPT